MWASFAFVPDLERFKSLLIPEAPPAIEVEEMSAPVPVTSPSAEIASPVPVVTLSELIKALVPVVTDESTTTVPSLYVFKVKSLLSKISPASKYKDALLLIYEAVWFVNNRSYAIETSPAEVKE